jgi:hypothetical protein
MGSLTGDLLRTPLHDRAADCLREWRMIETKEP